MTEMSPITLKGVPGSPYTRKMLALLRFRRLPYRLLLGSHDAPGMPAPKVSLLPTFYFPDASGELQAVTDSSPTSHRIVTLPPGSEYLAAFRKILANA